MKKCTFLIVTPVLNGAEFITECIASIRLAFQHFAFKHVIVDGGSTDNTEEIIKDNEHSDLVFLRMPGSTMYQAINKGVDYIEADYFYQLNADDLVLPETPNIIYRYFQSDNSIAVISGSCLTVNSETNYCKLKVPTKNHFKIDKLGVNLFVSQPSSFVRYSVIKESRGYCEDFKITADMELWLRLIKQGYKFYRINSCLSIDRVHRKCIRLSPECINELNIIRKNYCKVHFLLPLLRLRNAIIFLLTQIGAVVGIQNVLQKGMQSFGSLFFRIWGVFFSTKKAGIKLDYPGIKGTYGFQGRFF